MSYVDRTESFRRPLNVIAITCWGAWLKVSGWSSLTERGGRDQRPPTTGGVVAEEQGSQASELFIAVLGSGRLELRRERIIGISVWRAGRFLAQRCVRVVEHVIGEGPKLAVLC